MYNWIRNTFPNTGHRLVNTAIPATTSSFIEPCVYTLLPPGDVDLIFLEYTVNDSAEDQRGTTAGQMVSPARSPPPPRAVISPNLEDQRHTKAGQSSMDGPRR